MSKNFTKTNYFRVTDKEKFEDIINRCETGEDNIIHIFTETDADGDETGCYAFFCYDNILGIPDPENYGTPSTDLFRSELQSILPDDEAIIIISVGYNARKDVWGETDVITKGDWHYLDLGIHARETAKKMIENKDWRTKH